MNLHDIYGFIDSNLDAHLAKIREFLRQPSISSEDFGIGECAELLRQYYVALGCGEAEVVQTDGHPGVWAYYDAGSPVTLVNYFMYDVQPVAGQQWSSPPFDAQIARIPGLGRVIVARGAFN